MFALQADTGEFFCYTDKGIPGGFKHADECVNLWINIYPRHINKHRNRLLGSSFYRSLKIKTVELTPKQLEHFTFVKLRGMR